MMTPPIDCYHSIVFTIVLCFGLVLLGCRRTQAPPAIPTTRQLPATTGHFSSLAPLTHEPAISTDQKSVPGASETLYHALATAWPATDLFGSANRTAPRCLALQEWLLPTTNKAPDPAATATDGGDEVATASLRVPRGAVAHSGPDTKKGGDDPAAASTLTDLIDASSVAQCEGRTRASEAADALGGATRVRALFHYPSNSVLEGTTTNQGVATSNEDAADETAGSCCLFGNPQVGCTGQWHALKKCPGWWMTPSTQRHRQQQQGGCLVHQANIGLLGATELTTPFNLAQLLLMGNKTGGSAAGAAPSSCSDGYGGENLPLPLFVGGPNAEILFGRYHQLLLSAFPTTREDESSTSLRGKIRARLIVDRRDPIPGLPASAVLSLVVDNRDEKEEGRATANSNGRHHAKVVADRRSKTTRAKATTTIPVAQLIVIHDLALEDVKSQVAPQIRNVLLARRSNRRVSILLTGDFYPQLTTHFESPIVVGRRLSALLSNLHSAFPVSPKWLRIGVIPPTFYHHLVGPRLVKRQWLLAAAVMDAVRSGNDLAELVAPWWPALTMTPEARALFAASREQPSPTAATAQETLALNLFLPTLKWLIANDAAVRTFPKHTQQEGSAELWAQVHAKLVDDAQSVAKHRRLPEDSCHLRIGDSPDLFAAATRLPGESEAHRALRVSLPCQQFLLRRFLLADGGSNHNNTESSFPPTNHLIERQTARSVVIGGVVVKVGVSDDKWKVTLRERGEF